MKNLTTIGGIICCLFISNLMSAQETSATTILQQSIDAIDQANSYHLFVRAYERNKDDMDSEEKYAELKIQKKPRIQYTRKMTASGKFSADVFYDESENPLEVTVSLSKLLPNLSIDLYSQKLRERSHYLLSEMGFSKSVQTLKNIIMLIREPSNNAHLNLLGDTIFQDRPCYKIQFTNSNFHYKQYTTKPGEGIEKMASRLHTSSYLIVSKNDLIKDFAFIGSGESIKIPSFYAKEINLLIDKETMHPISMESIDEIGTYEKYVFEKIVVDPPFEPKELSKSYKKYSF